MIEILDGTRETVSYREHFGIRLYMNQVADDYPVHWHTAIEIIMPIENIYTAIVDDTKYVLHPGDILIIPSGVLHQLFAPETGERLILQCDYALFYNMNGFDSAFTMLRPCCLVTPNLSDELHSSLKSLLLAIIAEYSSTSLLREAQTYAMLIHFFVALGRNMMTADRRFPHTSNQKRHKYIDQFLQVCQYMRKHCTEDIQVEDLAELAGFSKFHFARLFKQFTGMSYSNYLNQQRIIHAEKLLLDPDMTIMEVAMGAGFGSLATFNRVFKSYKKCTPSEYKNLHGVHTV
jgi:AraC-like DNA-binding protein